MEKIRKCQNNCIFCFIRQQPKNLRKSLKIFDDDYVHSYFYGNYITLTNLKPYDWFRIYHWKLSPLYISVHTTNSELRVNMLRNKKAGNILKYLNRLKEHNIKFHTQIVVCPDWNDKQELDKTINDLINFYPSLLSIAVIPVGLTKYRENLINIRPINKNDAIQIINQIEKFQMDFKKRFGLPIVYLADEFYIKADKSIPNYKHYNDFAQLENGVGIVAKFLNNWKQVEKKLPNTVNKPKEITMVTGLIAKTFLLQIRDRLNCIKNLKVKLKAIPSVFWGENITVSGLITGFDILEGLKKYKIGHELWIPEVMIRGKKNRFLDDISINDLENKLNTKVKVISDNLNNLIKILID